MCPTHSKTSLTSHSIRFLWVVPEHCFGWHASHICKPKRLFSFIKSLIFYISHEKIWVKIFLHEILNLHLTFQNLVLYFAHDILTIDYFTSRYLNIHFCTSIGNSEGLGNTKVQRTRWRKSRWTWSTCLSTDTSDTEVHTEHQLSMNRRTCPVEKGI